MAIVQSYNLDATLTQVIDLVVGQAFKAVPENVGEGPAPLAAVPPSHSNQTNTHGA